MARRHTSRPSASGRPRAKRSSFDERRDRELSRGIVFLAKVALAALCILGVRLVQLQVVEAGDLSKMATERATNQVTLSARRGTIYDRNGNVLAASEKCSTLYCNPMEIENEAQVAHVLAAYLGGSPSDYHESLAAETSFSYVARRVDTDVAEKILETLATSELTGVYELPDVRRTYPFGDVAGQVLGLVGDDGQGLTGLEFYYDDILRGTDGYRSMEVGNGGTPVAGGAYTETPAVDGQDIVISLDIEVQKAAEEIIAKAPSEYGAKGAMACIMDPETGEIIAMCWSPLMPAGDASKATPEATTPQMIALSYEPGSVSKVLTTAIGLETGAFTTDTVWDVPAQLPSGDGTVSDDDGRDYSMAMNPNEILRRSSNVGAMTEGQAIGNEGLSSGLAAFGIGEPTGIDFPGETTGIVRSVENWDATTLNSMSFGQAYSVPPIQVLRAVASIGNHGVLVTPHFLVQKGSERVEWPQGERAVTPRTATAVAEMMRCVVDEGTAMAAKVPGFSIGGKTGTAQKADTEHGGYLEDEVFSSFVGFAGIPNAKMVCYVGVDGGLLHGGESCAPIFSTLMQRATRDLALTPDRPEEVVYETDVRVVNVDDYTVETGADEDDVDGDDEIVGDDPDTSPDEGYDDYGGSGDPDGSEDEGSW